MKISQSYLNFNDEYPSSTIEITDRQLTQNNHKCCTERNCKNKLLPLESQSHRNYGRVNHRSFAVPKRCRIAGETYSETAFSILQYQLKDRPTRQTHLRNLKLNLERRIQIAKAKGNTHLVNLLTQESREIASLDS